jgi:von Willebrand factor type A domain
LKEQSSKAPWPRFVFEAMNPTTHGSQADVAPSFNVRFVRFISQLRFLTVSFLIHTILVLLCGGVVLYRAVQTAPDFVSSGGPLVNEAVDVAPLVVAVAATEQELKSDPTAGVEMLTVSTSSSQFVVPITNLASMNGKTLGDMASKIDGAAKGLASMGGGLKRVGGRMKFMGVQSAGTSVVFVVDVSGSMISGEKSVKTYEVLEREVIKFIKDLDEKSAFGIVVFSKDARSYKQQLVRANREEKERGVNWLKKLTPENYRDPRVDEEERAFHHGTRADRGLAEAFEMQPDIIFFVSDGEPTGASPTQILKQVEESQTAATKKTAINAVAYLADSGQKFMRELAEKNGGTFREVSPRDVKQPPRTTETKICPSASCGIDGEGSCRKLSRRRNLKTPRASPTIARSESIA